MHTPTPDLVPILARLETLADRVRHLELQLRGLIESATVEGQALVLQDARGHVRARWEVVEHAPRLTFYDTAGVERLRVGLNLDATPAIWADGREIALARLDGD